MINSSRFLLTKLSIRAVFFSSGRKIPYFRKPAAQIEKPLPVSSPQPHPHYKKWIAPRKKGKIPKEINDRPDCPYCKKGWRKKWFGF